MDSTQLVAATLAWVSPRLREWYDDERLSRQLAAGLATEVARIGDAEFGAQWRDLVDLDIDDDPLHWANRRIDLEDGGWAVTGIRYRGRDVTRPFVDVITTTEQPTPDGLRAVAAGVLPAYAGFRPLALRFEAPDPMGLVAALEPDHWFGPRCAVDLHVVAAPVVDLRARPRAAAYSRVELRSGSASTLAARVAAIYDELASRCPEVLAWASPESEESLAECEAEGLLFEVRADGQPAGVVAALRDDAHAMSGFCVQELCLAASHRGRGLASGALQRLVDRLPASQDDVLWGTIHPENTPSLRNALSVGRELVGGYAWVTPAGLPGMP